MRTMNLTKEVRRQLASLPLHERIVMRLRLGYHLNMLRWLDKRYERLIAYRGCDLSPPEGHCRYVGESSVNLDRDDEVVFLRMGIVRRRAAIDRLVALLYRRTRGEVPTVFFATREEIRTPRGPQPLNKHTRDE